MSMNLSELGKLNSPTKLVWRWLLRFLRASTNAAGPRWKSVGHRAGAALPGATSPAAASAHACLSVREGPAVPVQNAFTRSTTWEAEAHTVSRPDRGGARGRRGGTLQPEAQQEPRPVRDPDPMRARLNAKIF